jgi:hypothetical protein
MKANARNTQLSRYSIRTADAEANMKLEAITWSVFDFWKLNFLLKK